MIACTVELFGVARMLAGRTEVTVSVPDGATTSQVIAAVAATLPVLVGRVITPAGDRLAEGCACSLNGRHVVRAPTAPVRAGDRILILSADAGG